MRTTNKKNDEENSHDHERTTKADVATTQDIIFLVAASIHSIPKMYRIGWRSSMMRSSCIEEKNGVRTLFHRPFRQSSLGEQEPQNTLLNINIGHIE